MSDYISRQEALDAMETWDKFGCDPDGKLVRYDDDKHYIPYVHYEDMVHAIKHLPSAQPEQRWIPVNKELPKKDGEYLVTVGGEATFPDVDTAWFYYGHWIHQFGCTVKVIAWMPLPEPYREERTEE